MQVGIVGLPQSGKTTIYNALTRSNASTSTFGKFTVNTAIVDVLDPRVDILSAMFNPRKTTYAKVQFKDVAGAGTAQNEGEGLAPAVLNALNTCDALVYVLRVFEDETVAHPKGSIDAARDLEDLRLEMIISDLAVVERRIVRLESDLKKARASDRAAVQAEMDLMKRIIAALEDGQTVSSLGLAEEENQMLRGFQFLSAKPTMLVLNLGEDDDPGTDYGLKLYPNDVVLALRGSIEMEISQLDDEEREMFLESYGIKEPSLNIMVRAAYNLLGLMSFFTVGEDEVRAWTVRRGAPAVEAAGTIHSDLARGFIRAEVLAYNDMMACKTLAAARSEGKLRLEGKEYIVQDGDILNIRFAV